MENKEHKCRLVYKETVSQQRFWQTGERKDDKLFAIMECIDCKAIKKQEL